MMKLIRLLIADAGVAALVVVIVASVKSLVQMLHGRLKGCVRYCDEKQLIGQFFTFGPLEGGPSGSSCVASARLRGRG